MYLLPPPDMLAKPREPNIDWVDHAPRNRPASPETRRWLRHAALFHISLIVLYAFYSQLGGYIASEIIVTAIFLAQCLLSGWGLALGPGPLAVRFWLTLAWSVAIAFSSPGIFNHYHGIGFLWFLGAWSIVSLLGLNAVIIRKLLGWSLFVPASEELLPKPQFSIRQLLFLTFLVSLYLGMARITDNWTLLGSLPYTALVLATPSLLLPAWLTLRVNSWKAACVIGSVVVLLPPATLLIISQEPGSMIHPYHFSGMVMFALSIVATTLLMIRAAGYRLGPRKSRG